MPEPIRAILVGFAAMVDGDGGRKEECEERRGEEKKGCT